MTTIGEGEQTVTLREGELPFTLCEGELAFTFEGCDVGRYDKWSFYRKTSSIGKVGSPLQAVQKQLTLCALVRTSSG